MFEQDVHKVDCGNIGYYLLVDDIGGAFLNDVGERADAGMNNLVE